MGVDSKNIILKAENISKQYRLGEVGTGTLSHDLNRWWHKVRGKDDPFLKVGESNDRSTKGSSDYVWALQDINFEVKQGEVLGIIGKNGAGKSTLLKILSRVTSPSTGEIKTKGRIASLLEVGTGFHPELTGHENIYLNGAILGMTKAEIKAKEDEIVSFSGCERYIDTPVKRYSSGMRVRLAFAVAAHLEPDILVIDEVLAVGDAEFQKKAIGKMQDISKTDGRTVLFVSHNILAVKSLCNRGILLEHGKIKTSGDIDHVIEAYLSTSKGILSSKVNLEKEASGFTLHSVKVSNNGITGNFNINEDLVFDIEFSSSNLFESINLNLFFNTLEGTNIFTVCSPAEEQQIGNYKYQCTVPKNTLNDIIYSLNIMVVINETKVIMNIEDFITIEGIENKRNSAWLGKFPGLIRPQYFNWKKMKNES